MHSSSEEAGEEDGEESLPHTRTRSEGLMSMFFTACWFRGVTERQCSLKALGSSHIVVLIDEECAVGLEESQIDKVLMDPVEQGIEELL